MTPEESKIKDLSKLPKKELINIILEQDQIINQLASEQQQISERPAIMILNTDAPVNYVITTT